jgi:hypothetical protein
LSRGKVDGINAFSLYTAVFVTIMRRLYDTLLRNTPAGKAGCNFVGINDYREFERSVLDGKVETSERVADTVDT